MGRPAEWFSKEEADGVLRHSQRVLYSTLNSLNPHEWGCVEQPFNHVVKYSTISTGQLSTSQCLHLRPIDVLVLHGSSVYPEGDIETLS